MNILKILAAGDSASWNDDSFVTADGRNVTPDAYNLMYCLRSPHGAVDLETTPAGAQWQTVLTTTQSAALNTGAAPVIWFWQAYATKTDVRILVGEGSIEVKPNFAVLASVDGRTQEERDLEAVKMEISRRANNGATVEYSIGSRSLKKEPLAALIQLQDRLQAKVNRQRNAKRRGSGQGNTGKVLVRFR